MSEFDKQNKKNYFDSADDSDEEAEISNQETSGPILSKEEVDKLVDELKNKGNEYYKNSDFDEALKAYTDAINFLKNNKLEKNSVLLLNRSATFLALKRYVPALNDANQAIELNPNTWKGHWRKGVALMAMSQRMFRTKQAIEAFESCKKCSDLPSNKTKEVDAELWKARRRMAEQEAQSPPPDLSKCVPS